MTGELLGKILGTVCFIIWVPCMISWIKNRVKIPGWVHILALCLTCLGGGCLIGLTVSGIVTLTTSIILILLPPFLTYFGWFWMHGPDLNEKES